MVLGEGAVALVGALVTLVGAVVGAPCGALDVALIGPNVGAAVRDNVVVMLG